MCLFPAQPLDFVPRTVLAKWMSYADFGSSMSFLSLPTIQVGKGSRLSWWGELAQLNLGHTGGSAGTWAGCEPHGSGGLSQR